MKHNAVAIHIKVDAPPPAWGRELKLASCHHPYVRVCRPLRGGVS